MLTEGYGETVGVQHTGPCRTVKRFGSPWLGDLARSIENELGSPFEAYGASLRVLPTRISHVRDVGEGVQLDLAPHDVKTWESWGDFESDIEVRRRRRFSRRWRNVLTPEQVEAWLRREAAEYQALLGRVQTTS